MTRNISFFFLLMQFAIVSWKILLEFIFFEWNSFFKCEIYWKDWGHMHDFFENRFYTSLSSQNKPWGKICKIPKKSFGIFYPFKKKNFLKKNPFSSTLNWIKSLGNFAIKNGFSTIKVVPKGKLKVFLLMKFWFLYCMVCKCN